MSIHYKFKSALDYDTLSIDGLHISVSDLKQSIISQKHLGQPTDYDLKITNAQTKEEYADNTYMIPKNSSIVIVRVPKTPKKPTDQKLLLQQKQQQQQQTHPKLNKINKESLVLSTMGGSEEDKIREMMLQSAADYDPKGYQRLRGQPQMGEVPKTYRCHKCQMGGHWIKNCPNVVKGQSDIKRTTGIPKALREKNDTLVVDKIKTKDDVVATTGHVEKIPEDLLCGICNDVFNDAVMMPCCGSSFCDECVRTSLLESADNECPQCGEKGCSPALLIPNRFLRKSVLKFKND